MTLFARNWEKCQPNLTDPDAYEQQLQQKFKGLALRFVEPWLLAFVNTVAKQGRCQPVMVCYALLGKTRGKVSTATALENFRYMNSGRGGVKHPTLQPSSSLFQIAVLVCPDAGVQIELSKVVTHRQRQWGFLAERALSYSCFSELH
ncbi:hypothetical protein AWI32_18035 [Enterobacter bugandensis]|nr:hypothetical protein AWI32_18035 [Enterobacter bugandensis]